MPMEAAHAKLDDALLAIRDRHRLGFESGIDWRLSQPGLHTSLQGRAFTTRAHNTS